VDDSRFLEMHVVDFAGDLGPAQMLLDPMGFNFFRMVPVPEPGSLALLITAAMLAVPRRRRS